MAYHISRFGWLPDPLDGRDFSVRDARVRARLAVALPCLSTRTAVPAAAAARNGAQAAVGALRVDLRPWCSPIEDQGDVGSCTAHAVIGALEYFERKTHGEHVNASRLFLYKVTRRFLGWDGRGDTGAFIRSTIKALRLFGAVPENYWPHDTRSFDREPEAFHYAFAQNFRAVEYFRLDEDVDHLRSALDAGLPFAFGFTCFTSLDWPSVTRSGVIPYPRATDSVTGGHAVLAVGYTDSHVLIRNSWGTAWGDRGYGYLPWTYFDGKRPLATDCWALVNAAWVPEDDADADVERRPRRARRAAAATAAPAPAAPPPPVAAEAAPALITVVRGHDPLDAAPLRLTAQGVRAADGAAAPFLVSAQPASLYLKSLVLNEDFDFALLGAATNELYLTAVAWDLSGAPPRVFPPATIEPVQGVYRTEPGQRIEFVGDGLQLWPHQHITGGLYVRLLVIENDDDVRAIGTRLQQIRDAVETHELTKVLAALAVSPQAATIAAAGAAATALIGAIGDLLAADGDDVVALFDGTYGAEYVDASRSDAYHQAGASIELRFEVGGMPTSGQVLTVTPRRRTKPGTRANRRNPRRRVR